MKFLKFRNDYLQKIAAEDLNELLAANPLDEEEALMDIEAMAVSTITGHLENRYDLEGLRGRRFREEQGQVKGWAIAIATYLLYDRAGARITPEINGEYRHVMEELRSLKAGDIHWNAPQARNTTAAGWPLGDELGWDFEVGPFDEDLPA